MAGVATPVEASAPGRIADFAALVKFRLTFTVVLSSVMAYLIAAPTPVSWNKLLILTLGGFLVTGAANALNQVLEKDFDRLMTRTANRPLASGRMKTSDAVLLAGFMSLFGISFLAMFNPWTAFFGTFSLVCYAFVYTPLKRETPLAVTVGAVPGALPTLIGCVAAQGELTWLALVLFGIQFFWQFPHFWSIGYLGFEDYSRAGYAFIPTKDGHLDVARLSREALFSAALLVLLAWLPFVVGVSTAWAAAGVSLLGVFYALFALKFHKMPSRKTALGMMFYSFGYIPFALLIYWADKIIQQW